MYIGGPRIDLSSTNIRNIVSKKAKPKELISKNVMDYINTIKFPTHITSTSFLKI